MLSINIGYFNLRQQRVLMDNLIHKVMKKTSKVHLKGVTETLCVCKIRKEASKHSSVGGTGCDFKRQEEDPKSC